MNVTEECHLIYFLCPRGWKEEYSRFWFSIHQEPFSILCSCLKISWGAVFPSIRMILVKRSHLSDWSQCRESGKTYSWCKWDSVPSWLPIFRLPELQLLLPPMTLVPFSFSSKWSHKITSKSIWILLSYSLLQIAYVIWLLLRMREFPKDLLETSCSHAVQMESGVIPWKWLNLSELHSDQWRRPDSWLEEKSKLVWSE